LIGLIGGLVFIGSYSFVLGAAVSAVAWMVGVVLVLAALFAHYVRPVALDHLLVRARLPWRFTASASSVSSPSSPSGRGR